MKHNSDTGFTIIETVFFLAISGLMLVGLVAGVTLNINTNRYKDSVNSFRSYLQNQYSKVENIENSRVNQEKCSNTAVTSVDGSGSSNRGTSECVVIGRYLTIEGDRTNSYPLVAMKKSAYTSASGDVQDLYNNYTIRIDRLSPAEQETKWGMKISYPTSGPGAETPATGRKLYVMMVRSPKSGSIYTFSSKTSLAGASLGSEVQKMATSANRKEQNICLTPEDVVATSKLRVVLEENMISPNGIQVQSNDLVPDGGTKC